MKKEVTPKEFEVLKLTTEGLSSREIAMLLGNSVRTIEVYRATLLRKYNCKNVAHLCFYIGDKNILKKGNL